MNSRMEVHFKWPLVAYKMHTTWYLNYLCSIGSCDLLYWNAEPKYRELYMFSCIAALIKIHKVLKFWYPNKNIPQVGLEIKISKLNHIIKIWNITYLNSTTPQRHMIIVNRNLTKIHIMFSKTCSRWRFPKYGMPINSIEAMIKDWRRNQE